jgi:hypothetical protein
MRDKIIIGVIGVLLCSTGLAQATITNVQIIPEQPILTDSIIISVNGIEGSGRVQITSTDFAINDNSLSLDISLSVGPYTVVTPWSHSEVIGTLPQGYYDLTVRTFDYYHGTLLGTYPTVCFTVAPEPSTLAVFGFALPIFRYFSKRII